MDNLYEKVIICLNDKNSIIGFVAVSKNKVTSIPLGSDNAKDVFKRLMSNLLKAHPDVATKDNIEEELLKEGLVATTKENLIVQVEIFEGKEVDNNRYVLHYVDGTEKTVTVSDCYDIEDYKMQLKGILDKAEDYYYKEIFPDLDTEIEELKNRGLVRVHREKEKEGTPLEDDGAIKPKFEPAETPEKEGTTPVWATPKMIKIAAGVTAISLITTGLSTAVLIANFKKNKNNNPKPEQEHDLTVDLPAPTETPFAEVTATATSIPTPEPTVYLPQTATPEPTSTPRTLTAHERALMKPITLALYQPDDSTEIVRILPKNPEEYDQSYNVGQGFQDIGMGIDLLNQNVTGYTNYMYHPAENSKPNYAYYVRFENYFRNSPNKADAYFVKHFSDIANDCIYLYFIVGDDVAAQERVRDGVYETLRFYQGGPVETTINGHQAFIFPEDISSDAYDAVRKITDGFHIMLGDQEVEFDGQYWNRDRISSEIYHIPSDYDNGYTR